MYNLKLFVLVILIEIVKARISIDVKVNQDNNITISYSGFESNIITDDDIKSFKIEDNNLKEAVKKIYGKVPDAIYLKSPSDWYKIEKFLFPRVEKVLSIKSATVKAFITKPEIILAQNFENTSNQSIKVNTGIRTINNTLTTSWSKQKEITVSQNIQCDINVSHFNLTGRPDFSFTSNWGSNEEKSKTETFGAETGTELTLQPGQEVKEMLSANACYMEIEVVYKASLIGSLVARYEWHRDDFTAFTSGPNRGLTMQSVMESGGIRNEITRKQTIKFYFYVDASLKMVVVDKPTEMQWECKSYT